MLGRAHRPRLDFGALWLPRPRHRSLGAWDVFVWPGSSVGWRRPPRLAAGRRHPPRKSAGARGPRAHAWAVGSVGALIAQLADGEARSLVLRFVHTQLALARRASPGRFAVLLPLALRPQHTHAVARSGQGCGPGGGLPSPSSPPPLLNAAALSPAPR